LVSLSHPPYLSKEIPVDTVILLRPHAAFPEAQARLARAQIVSAQLFRQLLVFVHYPVALQYARLGRISFATLAHGLKSADSPDVSFYLT
jgi:hypothetical protein